MPTRYTNTKIVGNDNEFYSSIRRGRKKIRHHQTPRLRNPARRQRGALQTATHIWKYGDRFYKLANDYYGDVRYWWVISKANPDKVKRDSFFINPGLQIRIPQNTQDIIEKFKTLNK